MCRIINNYTHQSLIMIKAMEDVFSRPWQLHCPRISFVPDTFHLEKFQILWFKKHCFLSNPLSAKCMGEVIHKIQNQIEKLCVGINTNQT